MTQPKRKFEATWPLFGEGVPNFSADPFSALQQSAPASSEIAALDRRDELPPETTEQSELAQRTLRDSVPPAAAPEWMRAARALADWLEQRIALGAVAPAEQAAIARTWAAFCLGGTTEPQVLRVAHLVHRAHTAIRETPRSNTDLQAAYHAAAGVLHAGLPSAIRNRMPLERAVYVVRRLRDEADAWAAIVEGTSELLGWKDYARAHAASVIRDVLDRNRNP
jgi:hypothetical protein